MRTIPVRVDTHLRVDANLLGVNLVDKILDELTIDNPAKAEAQEAGRWGWEEMEDEFICAELDGDTLVVWRGYALQLKLLLREHDIRIHWVDKTRWTKGALLGKEEFSYRPQQPAAVAKMRKHRQGIYKAPTGSGKTVTACGFIWETCPRQSLILVDRINLVDQWIDRIEEHMGIPREEIGRIGEGKWSEGRVTVATVQTLHKRKQALEDAGWFDMWDVVILDECHHVTAETFQILMQKFPARYRLGMSATPDKTGVYELALNCLGEVFYETTQEELRELGLLLVPEVHVVPTKFAFTYWRDHKADKKGHCEKPGCKIRKPFHGHRNNYMDAIAALVNDHERNRLVLDRIAVFYELGFTQLVITSRTTQIEAMMEEWRASHGQFIPDEHVHVLVGKMTGKKKQELVETVENNDAPHIIFSTIAGEAFDVPKIGVVHLPFPTRNPRSTEQNVGRVLRQYAGKGTPIAIDYLDNNVSIFAGQFRTRRWECYEPLGFTVVVPEDEASQPKRKKGLMSLGG